MIRRRPTAARPGRRRLRVIAGAALGLSGVLAACGPKPVESFGPAPSATGDPTYWVEGYTRPGQLTREYGEGYAASFARQVCPGEFVVERVDVRPVQNAFDSFLYWQALVACTEGGAPADSPRPGPRGAPTDAPAAAPPVPPDAPDAPDGADGPLPLTPAG